MTDIQRVDPVVPSQRSASTAMTPSPEGADRPEPTAESRLVSEREQLAIDLAAGR